MATNTYLSIITLSVNRLNAPIKSQRVADWIKKQEPRASVAQWLRIRLPMQGTWVRALVWEDPTCHRATKPVSHNY